MRRVRSGGAYLPVPGDVSAETRILIDAGFNKLPPAKALQFRANWKWDEQRATVDKLYRAHPEWRDDSTRLFLISYLTSLQLPREQFLALNDEQQNALVFASAVTQSLMRDWYPPPRNEGPPAGPISMRRTIRRAAPQMPLAAQPTPPPVVRSPPPVLVAPAAARPGLAAIPGGPQVPFVCAERPGLTALTVANRFRGAPQLFFRVYRVNESLFCREGSKCVQSVTAPHSGLFKVTSQRRSCVYYKPLGLAGPGTTLRIYWSANPARLGFAGPPVERLDSNNLRIVTGREEVVVGAP